MPLAEYEGNVRQILQRLQRELDGAVVWATTTPVDETWHHQNKGFDRLEADVEAYNAAARAVAVALGVPIDDLFAVVEREGEGAAFDPRRGAFYRGGIAAIGMCGGRVRLGTSVGSLTT